MGAGAGVFVKSYSSTSGVEVASESLASGEPSNKNADGDGPDVGTEMGDGDATAGVCDATAGVQWPAPLAQAVGAGSRGRSVLCAAVVGERLVLLPWLQVIAVMTTPHGVGRAARRPAPMSGAACASWRMPELP